MCKTSQITTSHQVFLSRSTSQNKRKRYEKNTRNDQKVATAQKFSVPDKHTPVYATQPWHVFFFFLCILTFLIKTDEEDKLTEKPC